MISKLESARSNNIDDNGEIKKQGIRSKTLFYQQRVYFGFS
jgi:hypothetical protein